MTDDRAFFAELIIKLGKLYPSKTIFLVTQDEDGAMDVFANCCPKCVIDNLNDWVDDKNIQHFAEDVVKVH